MRLTKPLMTALFLAAITISGRASAQGGMQMPASARKADNGQMVLADSKGMTLYTLGRDSAGKSTCNGQCASNWPPFKADADGMAMGDWTMVTRDDGARMWAYKGKPLYYYAKDTKAGETNGDGMGNGAWKAAVP
jgi:predicted lipoprotein with Yx(FWY)xxD motif